MIGSAEKRRDVDNMKKKRLLRMVAWVMLACLTLTLCACSDTKDYSEMIVGEWQLSDSKHNHFPDDFVFSDDGTCDMDNVIGNMEGTCTWSVLGDTLKITFDYYDDAGGLEAEPVRISSVVNFTILSINETRLKLKFTRDGESETAEFRRIQ